MKIHELFSIPKAPFCEPRELIYILVIFSVKSSKLWGLCVVYTEGFWKDTNQVLRNPFQLTFQTA